MKNKKEYDNAWYAKNKDRIREKKVKLGADRRIRNLKFAVDYLKSHPCIDCGEDDFIVLDFDHVDRSTKINTISDMTRAGNSLKVIQQEIDKCEIRCSNCHRRKTARQLGWYRNIIGSEV